MAKTALVETQIDDGRMIVRQLEADGYQLDSALWRYDSEKDKWVLLIATPLVIKSGPKEAYVKIKESLDRLQIPLKTPTIDFMIIRPDHKTLSFVRSSSATTNLTEDRPVYVSGGVLGGEMFEGAFVYRLSR